MAINPNEIDIKNIIELIQSSSIKDSDLLVVGQGIYARKSTVLDLYNKFGVPSILTSLNSLQFQINQLNNTVGNSVLYSPQTKTAQQKLDARNNLDVYSKSETQTVVSTAITNLGNVVNYVNGVNVDNSDPKNPIVAEFRPIADYNNDMLNKADIDGNLTIGGIWFQDQVLSDRFVNYKQVWTALSNNTIEWGNIQLDKHVFLVDDINGVKIKVGSTEGTIWNTLNLTNVSQLNNDAGYLQANDLDGFIYDVQYNSSTHTITFYQQNEPNIVIDLPIEQLIKGVTLVGNDLIFTFEDGSTVIVPLNTLLVGVVKSINGLTPNSQGEIILNVTDIPNLSSELANKLDVRMAGLVSNLTQIEKDAILTKLGVVNNIVQVLGLSGNTITLSNGGGSISLNIANIGGLQNALDGKLSLSGGVMSGNILAQSISAQTGFDKLTFDKLENFGSPLVINSNDSLGIKMQANGVTVLSVNDGSIEAFENIIVPNGISNDHAVNLSQLNTKYTFPTGGNTSQYINGIGNLVNFPAIPTVGNGDIAYIGTGNITGGGTSSANQSANTNYSFDLTAQTKYDIGLGVSAYNSLGNYQPLLSNGLHTTLSSNQVNVEFEINTPVTDKSGNTRLIFGNTQSTDVVIHGAVANGDFKVKDSTGADMFRMNGSNKVPYFPQLPASQTMDGNLAIFDTGDGLWKHSTRISDLVTTIVLNSGLATKANVNGNNLTNIANWQSVLGINTSWNLQQVTNNGNSTNLALIIRGTTIGDEIYNNNPIPFLTNSGNAQIIYTGGLLASDNYADASLIPANGIYSKGAIATELHGTSADWNAKVSQSQLANYALLSQVYTQAQSLALFVGLNGVQTISDTKTFSSSPIVPNATLNGHAVNLGQLLGYGFSTQTLTAGTGISIVGNAINNTAPNVQSDWNATSGDALILNKPTIPSAPNNGLFIVQGTGALTGTGSTSANASNDTSATLDLTTQTKNEINLGVNASVSFNNYFGGSDQYYSFHHVQSLGDTVYPTSMHTQVSTAGMGTSVVNINAHNMNGAEVVLQGNSLGMTTFKINYIDADDNYGTDINIESGSARLFWDAESMIYNLVP